MDINLLLKRLSEHYVEPRCALNYSSAAELLFATILSAQCTDERVNKVTADLFKKYTKLSDYYTTPVEELEKDIQSTGFYHNKAKSIRESAERIDRVFNGEVPSDMASLLTLKGVARKTANVVLGNVFGIADGVVVDTHVLRLSKRMGLTKSDKPEKVEQDLMTLVPKSEWIDFSHRLILHGRALCQARKPKCGECFLSDICPSASFIL